MDRGFVSVERCEGVWSYSRAIGGWIELYRASQSLFFPKILLGWPIPVVTRSKAWVCCRWLDEIAGSNPAGA